MLNLRSAFLTAIIAFGAVVPSTPTNSTAQLEDPPEHMRFDAVIDPMVAAFPTLGTTHIDECDVFNSIDPMGSHLVPSPCWWPRFSSIPSCTAAPPPPPLPGDWYEAWYWLENSFGPEGGFPLNIGLMFGIGPAGLPPVSYDPREGTSPLVPPSPSTASGHVRWPRQLVGTTVDAATGTPLIQETDLELPFGSATFRHIRTFGQYHQLRHEVGGSAFFQNHMPGGEYWESTGNSWTMTTAPLLLIDVQYQMLAGTPGGPRRCVFMPDAHHAISFIQDTITGVYIAPPHFGAQLTHNGEWEEDSNDTYADGTDNGGHWVTRPTVFRIWLYDGSVCYTIRPLYEDVFPGFIPTPADRAEAEYIFSDHDTPPSLGHCANPIPYWGLCERIDDRYGNCIDIEYCEFRARNAGAAGDCQDCEACTVNYNEKGQVARIRLVSSVPFNTASDWATDGDWDAEPENPDDHPFDYYDANSAEPGVVEWTLLYTYRSFWSDFAYEDQSDPDLSYPHAFARENAIHSIHVYEGDKETGSEPRCRTIHLDEYYNPNDPESLGGGWWTESYLPYLTPIDSLETVVFSDDPDDDPDLVLPTDWSYTVHYLYSEPNRKDRYSGTDEHDDTLWYDQAYGYSCGHGRGAARLLKTTVTERFEIPDGGGFEEESTFRLYRYDSAGPTGDYADHAGYVYRGQQMTTLQHLYDHETIMEMLEELNADDPDSAWTVNHLISGIGPDGTLLDGLVEPFTDDVNDPEPAMIPIWDVRATRSLYAWDGFITNTLYSGAWTRNNGITGDWQEFQDTQDGGFAGVLVGSDFAALQNNFTMFMQPGVALHAERGIGGGARYYRTYRFYASHQAYDGADQLFEQDEIGIAFREWNPSWSPFRSVLHEPFRSPNQLSGGSWVDTGELPQRSLGETVWITVVDEFDSLFHAADVGDWSDPRQPLTRRALYQNAAGFVLMDRTWEFTDDGVVVTTDGYTVTYGYDDYGRLTHVYSAGWNSLGNPNDEQAAKGLITRFEYWPAADRNGDGTIRGPDDVPLALRAKGMQKGSDAGNDIYYSEITERLEEIQDGSGDDILRFDLITAVHQFADPTTSLDTFTSTPATTNTDYVFIKDIDDDGDEEPAEDWVIAERTTLGPPVALDNTGDRYRAHGTEFYDREDSENNDDTKRGRLRWRVYGMEPHTGSGQLATRFFDYYQYDDDGRIVATVIDAKADVELGKLEDWNGRYGTLTLGSVPVYPTDDGRDAPIYVGDAKHKVTKTLFTDRGPVIIEHPDGKQTQISYRRFNDGTMEIRTARGFTGPDTTDPGKPHGPGQITRVGSNSPKGIKHVTWDTWTIRDKLYNHDYSIIAETNTESDSSGRPTTATQTDWRGNEKRVEAQLDRFGTMARRLDPDKTISRTLTDPRGLPERLFIGTADGAPFWNNGIDVGPDNLALTDFMTYGAGETDAGLQTSTRRFRYHTDKKYDPPTSIDFTGQGWLQTSKYDWRMRPIWQQTCEEGDEQNPLRHTITVYDNLDRVRFVAEYGPSAPQPASDNSNAIQFDSTLYDSAITLPSAADILQTVPQALTETVYNAAGQVERVIEYDTEFSDASSYHATATYYDRKNNETFKVQPSTAAMITINDAEGRVISRRTVIDPFAAEPYEISGTDYEYDAQGRLIQVTTYERTHDGVGNALTLGQNANAVGTWQWSWYDYNGRLKATVSLGTGDSSNDHFVNGTPITIEDRPGDSPSLNADGTVTRGILPDYAVITCYRYDESGRQSAVATQLTTGSTPTYRIDRSYYDGIGNLRYTKENAHGTASQRRRTAYRYDSLTGQLTHIAAILPGHIALEYIFDAGNTNDPETDSIIYLEPDWDADDGTLQVTSIEYGAEIDTGDPAHPSQHNGWVKAVYLPHPTTGQPNTNPSLTFTYTIDGLVRTRTDALGRIFTHTYDQFGRRTRTDIDYNWPGSDPYESYRALDLADRMEYEYDARDRLIRATAIRDDNGNDIIITDNTYSYDSKGNLLAEQQSYGDAASADPLNNGDPEEVVTYAWDYQSYANGNYLRLDSIIYPEKLQTGLRRELDFEYGDATDLASDSLSRISAIHDLLDDVRADFDFAGAGRRVGVTTTRDASSMPSTVWSQSYASPGVVGYPGLDRHGRTTDLRFADGADADIHEYLYSYNAAGDRLSALIDQVGESNTRSVFYTYDQLSRLVNAERGTLLDGASGIDHGSDAEIAERVSWGLDRLGNWTEPAGEGGAFAGRVHEQWDGLAYGTLLDEQTHLTDHRNRLQTIEIDDGSGDPPALEIFTHDAAGNLVTDDAYWYQYDAFGRLASVHKKGSLTFAPDGSPQSGTPGDWQLSMAYDAIGRLIRIQKPWSDGSDHRESWLYYDGVRRIAEVFKDPIVGSAIGLGTPPPGGYTTYTEREYVWGAGYIDECLWQITKPGDVLHVLHDASKDVVALLDDTGAVARQYTYDPYGQVIADEVFGSPAHNRLGHHGLFFDRLDTNPPVQELRAGARGLYHNRNRTYDPVTGRFATSDPNGVGTALLSQSMFGHTTLPGLSPLFPDGLFVDGLNTYGYLGHSPSNRHDAMGLFLGYDDLVMAGFGALSGGMEEMIGQYADNMYADIEWAMDWDMGDDWNTRGDNSWVWQSFMMGAYRGLMNEVQSSLMIDQFSYAGYTKGAARAGKTGARMVRSMRGLNRRAIHSSASAAKKAKDRRPGEQGHHLVEKQMGGDWRRGTTGSGPVINVETHFHLSDIRLAFNRAYKNAGVVNLGDMSKSQAMDVINEVYKEAPRLRNEAWKYLNGK